MSGMLKSLLLLLGCLMAFTARAATEVVEINYLPLSEAVSAVKTQLSASGSVAAMPSRRIVVIDDDHSHLDRAMHLLKQLDRQPDQYRTEIEMMRIESSDSGGVHVSAVADYRSLPGGWVRISADKVRRQSRQHQSFQLRLMANQPGMLETGELRPYRSRTLQWLAGYGMVQRDSVEVVPITTGFRVVARPAGNGKVHLRIVPWMQRAGEREMKGRHEMLINLGTVRNPIRPPSGNPAMRLNAEPKQQTPPPIEISGAATEVTVKEGETITIAAIEREAKRLGEALMAGYSHTGSMQLQISLRITKIAP